MRLSLKYISYCPFIDQITINLNSFRSMKKIVMLGDIQLLTQFEPSDKAKKMNVG